jgi:hypothetical protein
MSENTVSHSVMEGGGAYNRHAAQQAAGGASAVPLLEQAARSVLLDSTDRPIVIADYGSSQGRNSLRPMKAAIAALRERVHLDRAVSVVHTDLPGNDFSTLFRLLEADPDSYLRDQTNVFASAVGRSFYERLFPSNSVTLGWSAYAILWPSRVPAYIPGHFYSTRSNGEVLEAFNRQGEQDWRAFLSHRATELRPGGRLIILVPARDSAGLHGTESLQDHANDVLFEMVSEGFLNSDERERMVLTAHPKGLADLLAPFGASGNFEGLSVEYCDVAPGPDPVWDAFQGHGSPEQLATQHAAFFRITFGPTLASALEKSSGGNRVIAFYDRLERGIIERVANDPVEMRAVLGTMAIVRQ